VKRLVCFVYQLMSKTPLVLHRPSLIEHTASALRNGLRQGTWEGKLPGERELSQLLQVSRPTLRAALGILSKEGWLHVERGRARSILIQPAMPRRRDARSIGLLSPVPLSELVPFASTWSECLRECLAKDGYELFTHLAGRWWDSASPERELEFLTEKKPAAVWVLFAGSEQIQRWFGQSSQVCVTSGSAHSGICLPSVDLDHRATCRHAAGRFLSMGHQRVVFLRQAPLSAGDLESEAGFLDAFRSHPESIPMVAEHDGTPLRWVGIEITDDAIELPSFRHPRQCAYILGSEREGLSPEVQSTCDYVVKIPTRFSVNLGTAGALVMYDRLISLGRHAPRPVGEGAPTEALELPVFGEPLYKRKERRRLRQKEQSKQ
jgi:hypothetical protein